VIPLGVVGPAAYAEAYSYLWDRPAAYAQHLASFSADSFRQLLERPTVHLFVAEVEETVVGFLTLEMDSLDPIRSRVGGAEIPRIYLLRPARGAGLGWRLLELAEREAKNHGAAYLWLDLMASAPEARRVYERFGLQQIGTCAFKKGVKPEQAKMVVMAKDLRR
jgi:ribosomal protein S18 acetylase RimI-like enzyme